MLERVVLNIARHRAKSLLTILISLLIVLFFFIYLSGLLSNIVQYESLGESLPVEGAVSNVSGNLFDDIRISAAKVQKLEKTGVIKNVRKNIIHFFDTECRVLNEDEAIGEFFQTRLMGINTEEALPDFAGATYAEGYSSELFSSSEAVCLVDENYLAESDFELGDDFVSTLYRKDYKDSEYTYKIVYTAELKLKIVGTYKLAMSESSVEPPQVIVPIKYLRELYREEDVKFTVHSMRFTLKNGFDLDKLKEEAKEIGFENRNPLKFTTQHVGKSLVLYDEAFIKTSEQLRKNINLMQIFAPFIFLIVAFIGFLVSYLLMQSRQKEFAIMRSLGKKKTQIFAELMLESFMLAALGGFIGVLFGLLATEIDTWIVLVIFVTFVLLYSLGTMIALILLNRFSVMEVLTKREE